MKKFLFFLILLSSALHAAELPPIHQAVLDGNVERVRELLDSDPSLIKFRNQRGHTLLFIAAQNGHTDTVRLLLGRGTPIEAATSDGETALLIASQNGHTYTVRFLLDRGAFIEATTQNGWTPLFAAALYGHTNTVRLLLDRCAKIEAACPNGTTPLFIAIQRRYLEIIKLLILQGAHVNMPTELAQQILPFTSPEIRFYLTETTPRTLFPTQTLLQAARGNWEELVVASVVEDADITATFPDGYTALHWAALHGNVPMANFLIKKGSAVNAQNIYGDTPLHVATREQKEAMVYGLLINGADPSIENNLHETPVHIATICHDLMATFIHAARQRREPVTTTHPQHENTYFCLIC
jgi:ankyrin repeat protein